MSRAKQRRFDVAERETQEDAVHGCLLLLGVVGALLVVAGCLIAQVAA